MATNPSCHWSTIPEAARLFFKGATVPTALPIALVVGTLLVATNQGSAILKGTLVPDAWLRIVVNFAVPFCVSSYAFLSARRIKS